jgi:hypothetical protein
MHKKYKHTYTRRRHMHTQDRYTCILTINTQEKYTDIPEIYTQDKYSCMHKIVPCPVEMRDKCTHETPRTFHTRYTKMYAVDVTTLRGRLQPKLAKRADYRYLETSVKSIDMHADAPTASLCECTSPVGELNAWSVNSPLWSVY